MTADPWAALRPPFAVLHRENGPGVEILGGPMVEAGTLAGLPDADLLALVPFRQIGERGFDHVDDGTPLSALRIESRTTMGLREALATLPRDPVRAGPGLFDLDDDAYAAIARTVVADEIGRGAGANFVLQRSFTTVVDGWSPRVALSFFARLLAAEQGAYWTFIVHTGTRTLVGATPERHVSLTGGHALMNPISGTYRYPPGGPDPAGLLAFLADGKETDELEMVVDEELKMMTRICDSGIRITGPRLRGMSHLAHTEYLLEGHTGMDAREVLRETMFAPTVTGSPLRSACTVIARYEPAGRGYYSGVAALIDRDSAGAPRMDSAILIRTADVDRDGLLRMSAGATLVRHSDADREAAETAAKLEGLRAALVHDRSRTPAPASTATAVLETPAVTDRLRRRNERLAPSWLDGATTADPVFAGRRCLVIDADDDFTAMLAYQLRGLGFTTTVRSCREPLPPGRHDLVVAGPGPGDPRDRDSRRMTALRDRIRTLLSSRQPFLAVCLSHQILCDLLALPLVALPVPRQGTARTIRYLDADRAVGFYNSYIASTPADRLHSPLTPAPVEVCRDPRTGEVYALHGSGFSSVQFHPESVLSRDGLPALRQTLHRILGTAPAPPPLSRSRALIPAPR